MLDLLEQTDYTAQLEEQLKEELDMWLSSQGWPEETSAAEYKKLYAERVTDKLSMPEDVDELVELCNENFEDGTFAIQEIRVPRDGVLTRVEPGQDEWEYSDVLDDSDAVLDSVQIP